jgi:hypothetical protein
LRKLVKNWQKLRKISENLRKVTGNWCVLSGDCAIPLREFARLREGAQTQDTRPLTQDQRQKKIDQKLEVLNPAVER